VISHASRSSNNDAILHSAEEEEEEETSTHCKIQNNKLNATIKAIAVTALAALSVHDRLYDRRGRQQSTTAQPHTFTDATFTKPYIKHTQKH
jgi:hypothetical protein